ncbi:MAG: hypothetical protein GY757_22190, partial [bacterium]|nr:hypothetical protein [bacterium]
KTADLFYRLTLMYTRMQNYAKAFEYLEKSRAMNPEMPQYGKLKNYINSEKNRESKK